MRIAYVSLHWPRTYESGVGKKIAQQIKTWRDDGHDVQFFMHMQTGIEENNLIPAVSTTYKAYPGLFGRFPTEFGRCYAIARLISAIRRYHPDVIYLRWGMYVFPAHFMFSIAPVVMEINTNDVFQHGLLGFVYGLYNRLTRGIFLSRAAGLIATSQELADAPEFASYHRPVSVITNGIEIDANRIVIAPHNTIPRLVFIGTPNLPWHGVDKLVELARNFPDLVIDLIGYDALDGEIEPPVNLKLHGYLPTGEYEKILTQVDLGIGTLALHRKGMEEASPLKTRECLAYGIPMVIPYYDSDLHDFLNPCILQIPNSEDNIRLAGEKIKDFAYEMRGKRIQLSELDERIGLKVKEKRRLAFMQECRDRSFSIQS
jgi:hypothetical protein